MNISLHQSRVESREPRAICPRPSTLDLRRTRAFTLIEIALCLAIIGFALLAIMIVLPYGMGAQRDNREETVIGQDAPMLLELIRSGSRGADDLTNYVYAVTNYWTKIVYPPNNPPIITSGANGYTTNLSSDTLGGAIPYPHSFYPLNSGSNIISTLSTPEFTDANGFAIRKLDPAFVQSGYSNHVVAYVRSISGLAAEKPPQGNGIMREDSFTYRLFIVNAPQDFDTPEIWVAQNYNAGDLVSYRLNGGATYWRATVATAPAEEPSLSTKWVQYSDYNHLAAGTGRELRLTFLWPQLPNGHYGSGRQIFRAAVGGTLERYNSDPVNNRSLYFYQPHYFAPTP